VCIVAEESSPWGVAGGVSGGKDEFSGKLMLMLIVLGAGGVGGGSGRSNRRGLRMTCIFWAVLQDGLAFGVPIGNSNGPLRVGRPDGGRSEAFGSPIPEAFGVFCPKEARVGKCSAVKGDGGGGGVMMDFAWSTAVGVGVGIQTGISGRQGALY
jgi:hypothetical protein